MQHVVGEVLSLFISQKGIEAPIAKEILYLNPKGIVDDKHYGSEVKRTVLITSIESYKLTEEKLGTQMPHGYLGENLLIDYNPSKLPLGTKVQMGTTILEITQNCTLCNHLAKLDKRIPKLLKNDRGIFAKVIKKGEITRGDTVSIIVED
jgi:MOSC domain-containing protein YiiM